MKKKMKKEKFKEKLIVLGVCLLGGVIIYGSLLLTFGQIILRFREGNTQTAWTVSIVYSLMLGFCLYCVDLYSL